MELHSGFVAPVFQDGYVRMNIGVKITENLTLKMEAEKASYIERGVKLDQCAVAIPRTLCKESDKIVKLFQTFGYNLYGKDPLEETAKQVFRDLGVDDSSYDLKVPNSLKDKEAEIMETFDVTTNNIEWI
jgi:hypothetical protein